VDRAIPASAVAARPIACHPPRHVARVERGDIELIETPTWLDQALRLPYLAIDPEHPQPRVHLMDQRSGNHGLDDLISQYAVHPRDTGYRAQFLLPWSNLGITPANGRDRGPQIYLTDKDAPDNTRKQLTWHPNANAYQSAHAFMPMQLADTAVDPIDGRLDTSTVHADGAVHVYGPAQPIGQNVTVTATDTPLASGRFEPHDYVARATVQLPAPPRDQRRGVLHAYVNDQRLTSALPRYPPARTRQMPSPSHSMSTQPTATPTNVTHRSMRSTAGPTTSAIAWN